MQGVKMEKKRKEQGFQITCKVCGNSAFLEERKSFILTETGRQTRETSLWICCHVCGRERMILTDDYHRYN